MGQNARWVEVISEFQFEVVHRPGTRHGNADAMSRYPYDFLQRDVAGREIAETEDKNGGVGVCGARNDIDADGKTGVNVVDGLSNFSMAEGVVGRVECEEKYFAPIDRIREAQKDDSVLGRLFGWLDTGVPDLSELLGESKVIKTWYFQFDQIRVIDGVMYRIHPLGFKQMVIPLVLQEEFLSLIHMGKWLVISGGVGHGWR